MRDPPGSVLKFLEKNGEWVRGKCFYCIRCVHGAKGTERLRLQTLGRPLIERITNNGGQVLEAFLAPGWFRKPPRQARDVVETWVRNIVDRLKLCK